VGFARGARNFSLTHYKNILGFCAAALKFFAVGYSLLDVSVGILP
jgi:hypothetical protein